MRGEESVAVLYVARGDAGAVERLSAFADAYLRHPAGYLHQLYFLAKGWHGEADTESLRRTAQQCDAQTVHLPDDGFDWAAYFRAALLVDQSWLCLLNSHTRPCVNEWLALLMNSASLARTGVIGATASWESPHWQWSKPRTVRASLRAFARSLRDVRYLQQFAHFPNSHVRSTGLVIPRTCFLEFAARSRLPADKGQAHALESSRHGLSAFVLGLGRTLEVAGANGHRYAPEEWDDSATFRAGGQTNLILRDNRTDQYDLADGATRRDLETLAWGRPLS